MPNIFEALALEGLTIDSAPGQRRSLEILAGKSESDRLYSCTTAQLEAELDTITHGRPTVTATTTSNITDAQIEALSTEAAEAGDLDQVALCEAALGGDDSARRKCERAIGNGSQVLAFGFQLRRI